MFSCSHYSDFLFDPIGKQSAMSNRGQEATTGEGSPMAIPKPMVPTKARPLNLVSRSPWSERNSSQNFGYLVNLENAECGNSLQTASKSEIIVSKHEIHEPSTHDLDLSVLTKDFGNYSKLLNFFNESIKNKCVNMGIFMSSSMKAAIHLGPNCLANLEVYKNTNFEENISLFNITQMMILELSEEILNVKPLESSSPSWTRSVLSHDQAITWTKAKVRVYSDSFLFVGKMNDSKDAITRWEGQVEEFKMYPSYKELSGIDGEAIEFDWNIFSGLSSLQILQEIQQDLDRKIIQPEEFTDRIIFMSMFNDIDWTKEMMRFSVSNAEKVKDYAMRILQRTLDVSGSWIGTEVVWRILVHYQWRMGLHCR